MTTNDLELSPIEREIIEDITQAIEHIEDLAHPCPCGKFSSSDCMGECGFNDLKPVSHSSVDDSFRNSAEVELPILSWTQSPSNPYVRSVCPEMLTESGYRVIDKNSPRNSSIPVSERPKAIFVYDREYVVATLSRIYSRLECDALQFIELACDACDLPDDSAIRHSACDDVASSIPVISIDSVSDENTFKKAVLILEEFSNILREFRANLHGKANDKGEYPVRYTHGIKLVERLEQVLKFDSSIELDPISGDDEMKAKAKRL